mgnify:CR=1 FL=1
MRPSVEALEQYLADCENKRRRARDRPSNQVLEELRALLSRYRDVVGTTDARDDADSDGAEPGDPPAPMSVN